VKQREDANVLVVDDAPENLRLLVRALSGTGYRVRAALGGAQGLQMARAEPPDLVLLDIDMPDLNGFQVCDALREDPVLRRVPILFVSAMQDADSKLQAFQHGGRDYVTKPFHVEEVLARVKTHVELRRLERALSEQNVQLEQRVQEQVREISDAQVATIIALAKLSEARGGEQGQHVERVGSLCEGLVRAARKLSKSSSAATDGPDFSEGFLRILGQAATLHDIGKVSVPDAVLLKPGKLTPSEYELVKTHAASGAKTLEAVLRSYPRNELVRVSAEIARSHHERWDGSGYPAGLAGEEIPLGARIVGLIDAYDAIRSSRPYKEALPRELAAQEIRNGSGTQFDPKLTLAFDAAEAELDGIWSAMQARQ
jgi:putative two-component system response regulator